MAEILEVYLTSNPKPCNHGLELFCRYSPFDPDHVFSSSLALQWACRNPHCDLEMVEYLLDERGVVLGSLHALHAFYEYLQTPSRPISLPIIKTIAPSVNALAAEKMPHPVTAAVACPTIRAEIIQFLFDRYGAYVGEEDLLRTYFRNVQLPTKGAIQLLATDTFDGNNVYRCVTALHALSGSEMDTELADWLLKECHVDPSAPLLETRRVPLHCYLHHSPSPNGPTIHTLATSQGWGRGVDVRRMAFSSETSSWETGLHALVANPNCEAEGIEEVIRLGATASMSDHTNVHPISVYLTHAKHLSLRAVQLLTPQGDQPNQTFRYYTSGSPAEVVAATSVWDTTMSAAAVTNSTEAVVFPTPSPLTSTATILHMLADREDLSSEVVAWCLMEPFRGTTKALDEQGRNALTRYLEHGSRPEVVILLSEGVDDTSEALHALLSNYRLNTGGCLQKLLQHFPHDCDVSLAAYLTTSPSIDLRVVSSMHAAHLVELNCLRASPDDGEDAPHAIAHVLRNPNIASVELPTIVAWLSESGYCDPSERDPTGKHPLQIHLENTHIEPSLPLIQFLLRFSSADEIVLPDDEWPEGGNALDVASVAPNRPSAEVFLFLSSKVANVNSRGRDLMTPLCQLLSGQHGDDTRPDVDVIRAFISEKTDRELALSFLFSSPYADKWVNIQLLELLVDQQTNVKRVKTPGGSAVHCVVQAISGVQEMVGMILQAGGDVSQLDNKGQLPLMSYIQSHTDLDLQLLNQLCPRYMDGSSVQFSDVYSASNEKPVEAEDGEPDTQDEGEEGVNPWKIRTSPPTVEELRKAPTKGTTALNVFLLSQCLQEGGRPDDIALNLLRFFVTNGRCACDVNEGMPDSGVSPLEFYLTMFMRPCWNIALLLSDEATDTTLIFERVAKRMVEGGCEERAQRIQEVGVEVAKFPPRASARAGGQGGSSNGPLSTQVASTEALSVQTPAASRLQHAERAHHQTMDERLVNSVEKDVSKVQVTDGQLRGLFASLDKDKTGSLSRSELKSYYRSLDNFGFDSDAELEQIMSKAFLGQSGVGDRLTYEQFALVMLKVAQR